MKYNFIYYEYFLYQMDLDLARTFLEVVRAGSFVKAANSLNVTQTAITVRIQKLEEFLNCSLFTRNKGGAQLTPDGQHFFKYASQLVLTWESARRNLPLPTGSGGVLILGSEVSLCNPLLIQWIKAISTKLPETSIRIEVNERQILQKKLQNGLLDAAIVHQPDYWPELHAKKILEEKLVLIRSKKSADPYVYVDWGEGFKQKHDAALPFLTKNKLSFDLGPLALQFILQTSGSGYFRTRVVQPYLQQGDIELVEDSPEFSFPIYLIHIDLEANPKLEKAIDALLEVTRHEPAWNP